MPLRRAFTCCAASAALVLGCAGPREGQITQAAAAARLGDTATLARLAAAGYDMNAVDPGLNHWTPLLHAIHKNQAGAVDALIAAGADVNRAASGGLTPLMMAVGNGNAAIVRRLLAAGANVQTDGPELLATAISGGAMTDLDNPLLGRCNDDVTQALLEKSPRLRLKPGFRARIALFFAWLNNCGGPLHRPKQPSS